MLVLSRQKDESIIIGEGDKKIEICVVDIRGDKVRIGVTAPNEIPVHRKEVYDAIQEEKKKIEAPMEKLEDSLFSKDSAAKRPSSNLGGSISNR